MSPSCDSVAPSLNINLSALGHNYEAIGKLVPSGASLGCVLKANAYGLGVEPIAKHLLGCGARYFFVARLDEGIFLREVFKKTTQRFADKPQIFLLSGVSSCDHEATITSNLIPIFSDTGDLSRWVETAHSLKKKLPYGLQVDTGINRLGLDEAAFTTIKNNPDRFQTESCRLIMSHLANGEDFSAPSNLDQKRRFDHVNTYFPHALISFSNSGGVFLGHSYHYDIIRSGISLYGIQIPSAQKSSFKVVVSLNASLIEINSVPISAQVGYGSTYSVKKGGILGIVNIGYADGYPWLLSGKSFMFKGYQVPIAGRISMDLLTIDLSEIPSHLYKKGEVIPLIGAENPWEEVAQKANLIPHVLLAQMGQRLFRRYHAD